MNLWELLRFAAPGLGVLSAAACACVQENRAGAQTFPNPLPLPSASELPSRTELPDPLVMQNGRRVTTRRQWEKERRPELMRLFQHYMYGYMPSPPPKLRAVVEREERGLFGGKAILREVALSFGPKGLAPIHVLMVLPDHVRTLLPVFVGINFSGNHSVIADPGVRIPSAWIYPNEVGVVNARATETGRGSRADVWNIEMVVRRGYGIALFYSGDVAPDTPTATDGVLVRLLRPGQTGHAPQDWGAVAAWAWGAQRVVDYLLTDRHIDPKRIAVVGHSRKGKAAILAAAFDERIALAIPLQAGCGGTSPSRGTVGESVERINTHFPHWFNSHFKEFNERPDRLPFDQNCLIALMAPRPVLLSNATDDTWANPAGQFAMLQSADSVYRLLGVEGLEAREMPEEGRLVGSRLGYFIRAGKHSMTRIDWEAFLEFADRHFGKPALP